MIWFVIGFLLLAVLSFVLGNRHLRTRPCEACGAAVPAGGTGICRRCRGHQEEEGR